ncbi:MAG TPA: hypothetical protein PKA41_04840 [Verrucomicrobiota bacterium]|nr:hypothetical protein [Verrucomicrobiota bacterium]
MLETVRPTGIVIRSGKERIVTDCAQAEADITTRARTKMAVTWRNNAARRAGCVTELFENACVEIEQARVVGCGVGFMVSL